MSGANTRTIGPLDPTDTMPLPLRPGDLVADRYEILRLAGSGGSAFVYAARDRQIGDEIALKLLREDIDVNRSRREAKIARLSDSQRLVRTFDLFDCDGLLFLTMELVPGGSLRERLRGGPLPVDEVIRLAREVLEALAVLHGADIVHRDLKPGNLLLTADGHIKLSDFGIARKWIDDQSRLTAVGTLAYMSPEQARGERVDPRSDLYSLGIVLFEMLTGRLPSVDSMVMRIDRRAREIRTLRRDTPRWLARIVARLLETKPEDRHQSAEEALADLRRRRARGSRRRAGVAADASANRSRWRVGSARGRRARKYAVVMARFGAAPDSGRPPRLSAGSGSRGRPETVVPRASHRPPSPPANPSLRGGTVSRLLGSLRRLEGPRRRFERGRI
jgi:serine/threonine protein kinase